LEISTRPGDDQIEQMSGFAHPDYWPENADFFASSSMTYAKMEGLVNSVKLPAHQPLLPQKYLLFHRSFLDANIIDQT